MTTITPTTEPTFTVHATDGIWPVYVVEMSRSVRATIGGVCVAMPSVEPLRWRRLGRRRAERKGRREVGRIDARRRRLQRRTDRLSEPIESHARLWWRLASGVGFAALGGMWLIAFTEGAPRPGAALVATYEIGMFITGVMAGPPPGVR